MKLNKKTLQFHAVIAFIFSFFGNAAGDASFRDVAITVALVLWGIACAVDD